MHPLLRHPGIVPSLFSDGIDCDDRPSDTRRRATSASWVKKLSVLLQDWDDKAAWRSGSVLAGAGIAVLICGKPLLHGAILLAGGPVIR